MNAPNITVPVMMNPVYNCMYCGGILKSGPVLINCEKTHVLMYCDTPGTICKYSERRLRLPLTIIQCELADG